MALTTAERNRRKRERKKKEKEARRKEEEEDKKRGLEEKKQTREDVEIEYVAEEINHPAGAMADVFNRFQERAALLVVTDEEEKPENTVRNEEVDSDEDDEDNKLSKRKLREVCRPSVADLKRRVQNPDLVEAHDVTARDPEFLIQLKGVPGSVPVPRHWGRKRKYLQGKRGYEKPPFQLPDFIMKTGITEIRDTLAENEADQNAKQKNRSRVAPKMGHMDVDYRTLHDAFFKHQTKPDTLTTLGDLYYEGKEMETRNTVKPGGPLSDKLKEALGMTNPQMPPPWLVNMQRYGPPPSYQTLKIPGLTAPLPTPDCQFGYHVGGWGKPPVDKFNRPMYGGNPFDPPGQTNKDESKEGLVTSDGKTLAKKEWGALPHADVDEGEESSEEEDESSDEEMEESEGEEEGEEKEQEGTRSVVPPPVATKAAQPTDLRKQAGNETPMAAAKPKQLYQVLEERKADGQSGQVFGSEVTYALPPEGAESVLSKAAVEGPSKKKRRKTDDDDDAGEFGKNFKF